MLITCKHIEQMSSFLKVFREIKLRHSGLREYRHLSLWVIIWSPIAWIAFVSAFTHPTWVFIILYIDTGGVSLHLNMDLNLIFEAQDSVVESPVLTLYRPRFL